MRLLLAATVDLRGAKLNEGLSTEFGGRKKLLFVDLLSQTCHDQGADNQALLEQSALEMLLAGTDNPV